MKQWILFFIFCSWFFCGLLAQSSDLVTKQGDSIRWMLGNIQVKTRNSKQWKVYQPENGFFQKAFTDKGDPRFMITNEDQTFKFGIGGFVQVITFADFNGLVEHNDFSTNLIPVPTNYTNGQFFIGAELSRLNVKTIGETKYGQLVAFIEADFNNPDKNFRMRHAYVSYFGFTIGQTWSTFMDLEAGPPTVDPEGANNQIALRQPMIRYTGHIGSKWEYSAALEKPIAQAYDYPAFDVYKEYQKYPDVPVHIKYKDKFGHLQLGAILRTMNYFDSINLKSKKEIGYGVALSGRINLFKNTQFFFQGVYGEGIAHYIQDLSFDNFDLVFKRNERGSMQTLPMYGCYASFSYNWRENLYSAIVYGYTKLEVPQYEPILSNPIEKMDWLYDHTHYFAINLFWDFIPYGTLGVEYLYGQRVNKNFFDGTKYEGHANRINLMIRYGF
ncbi:MAG: DcaP family trimeric outer membrane transporter [Bacteroidales bacterium]|nr:DcaP family trimeric outer membrane transporter [Bacteroidales bacterium]